MYVSYCGMCFLDNFLFLSAMNIVYIYEKGNKIKVLDHDTALIKHKDISADGWKHKATINPCTWIEYLYNDSIDTYEAVKCLIK